MRNLLSNHRYHVALLGLVLLVLWARNGLGQATQLPFRVEAAGAECADPEAFAGQLLRRTQRLRRAAPTDDSIRFRIGAELQPDGLMGHLSVRDLDGSEVERDVPGASCEEVMAAMVLIAAVLVDPSAADEPHSEEAPAQATPAVAEPSPSARPPAPASAHRPPAPVPPFRIHVGAGVALALESAVAPDPTPAMALELGAGIERSVLLSPLLALSLEQGAPTRTEKPNGVARFQWRAARLSGCPLRFPAKGAWAARPCVFFELGQLDAQGERIEPSHSANVPWRALGGALRVDYQAFGPLVLSVEGALVVPLHEDTFYFEPVGPATTAFVTPTIAPAGRFTLGLRHAY